MTTSPRSPCTQVDMPALIDRLIDQLESPAFTLSTIRAFARLDAAASVIAKYARAFLKRRENAFVAAKFGPAAPGKRARGFALQPQPYYGRVCIDCGSDARLLATPAPPAKPPADEASRVVPVPPRMRGIAFTKKCAFGTQCYRWGDQLNPCFYWHVEAERRKFTWLGPDGEPLEHGRAAKPGTWRRPEPERPKPFVKAPGPAANPWATPLSYAFF